MNYLSAHGITKRYPVGKREALTVLSGVSVAVSPGEMVSMIETGLHAGGSTLEAFASGASAVLIFSAPAGVAVTAAAARLAVDLGRAAYARWQLAVLAPRKPG